MKPYFLVSFFLSQFLLGESLQQADFGKLRDGKSSFGEAARLCRCDGKKKVLEQAWLLKSGAEEKESVHVLLGDYELNFESSYRSDSDYEVRNPGTLFEARSQGTVVREPGLSRIEGVVALFFDSEGKEIKPFGGNNYINSGYVCDINGDGVLERVEIENHRSSGDDGKTVESLSVSTIERVPQVLFRAIFNVRSVFDETTNGWDFHCSDEDGNGLVELSFGPASGEEKKVVFQWDQNLGAYQSDRADHPHLKVLKEGEKVADVAADFTTATVTEEIVSTGTGVKGREEAYQFESFTGKSHKQYFEFFNDRSRDDDAVNEFGEVGDDRLPEEFWELKPKQAVLSLVDHCRRDFHKAGYQVAIDDRNGLKPPESGWAVYRYSSSGCYSFSGLTCALRHGVKEPFLLLRTEESAGVVGRNPWADQSRFLVQKIMISNEEATFLSEILFWLDRVRSKEKKKPRSRSAMGSSGDGYGSLAFLPDGEIPREAGGATVWDTGSVKARWKYDYDRTTMVNLVNLLLREGIRGKWDGNSDERPGEGQLEESIRTILKGDQTDPIPAEFLERVVSVIAEDGLIGLSSEVKRLRASISKEPLDEEKELVELEKRFARDHFGNQLRDEPSEHPKDYQRMQVLEAQLRFDRGRTLRRKLALAGERLELIRDRVKLEEVADGNVGDTEWALGMLRKQSPDIWIALMMRKFHQAAPGRQAGIFYEVASADVLSARNLISQMDHGESENLIFEITEFYLEHFPKKASESFAGLMKLLSNREVEYQQRHAGFELVSRLELDEKQDEAFRGLIVKEIANPQTKEIYYSTEEAAFQAFVKVRPKPSDLEYLWSLDSFRRQSAGVGLALLQSRVSGHGAQEEEVIRFLLEKFESEDAPVHQLAEICWARNLREFGPMLESLATENQSARFVTAFWQEENEKTLARMWVDWMASKKEWFRRSDFPLPRLKEMAREAVKALNPRERAEWIEEAISQHDDFRYYEEEAAWLRSLK